MIGKKSIFVCLKEKTHFKRSIIIRFKTSLTSVELEIKNTVRIRVFYAFSFEHCSTFMSSTRAREFAYNIRAIVIDTNVDKVRLAGIGFQAWNFERYGSPSKT